jgi:predicted ATP-dependent endonuclease of OLD family
MSIISEIKLPSKFDAYEIISDKGKDVLSPISRINIFVGANNSGKSRFIRLLASETDYEVKYSDILVDNVSNKISSSLNQILELLSNRKIESFGPVSTIKINQLLPVPQYLQFQSDKFKDYREFFSISSTINENASISGKHNVDIGNIKFVIESIRQISIEALGHLEKLPAKTENLASKRVYIPTLRGLRSVNERRVDLYEERTKNDYFSDKIINKGLEIFTGLTFFDTLTKLLLGSLSDRKNISEYQKFLSDELFEGKPIALIPRQEPTEVVVKVGSELEQPIYNLGDGIQSIIILTFLPFIMKEPTFFFIEEPELFMHPGLQRKLINYLSNHKNHTFFLTTHSNHFLDLTIDYKNISVFTFRKKLVEIENNDEQTPTFSIEAVDGGDNSSLELLGVRNSSVFLVNATIWVEGITDRLYLRQMLNSYIGYLIEKKTTTIKLEEDTHYSFVEYGGSNITHFSFLDNEEHPIEVERLCGKAMILVDEDGCKKKIRIEKLKKELKERLIILPAREIENLLSYQIIKEVVLEYEGTPDRIIPNQEYNSYKNEYLGKFIESVMLLNDIQRKGGYKEESGTIKAKVDFCNRACLKIKYEELPSTTQGLIKEIYDFIVNQNRI